MKTYTTFLSDVTSSPALLAELNARIPFAEAGEMSAWFAEKGYSLAERDVELLYQNQTSLVESGEQVEY